MPLVAFLVATLFWPFVAAASTTPRWAMLSIAVPLLFHMKHLRNTLDYQCLPLGLFLLWCGASLLWSPDGLSTFWEFLVLGAIVTIGCDLDEKDYRKVVLWFSIGVAISGLLAVPQTFGWTGIEQAEPPAGLFMNKNFLAEAGLLALVGSLACGFWPLLPPLMAAVALPASLGAYLVSLGVALAWFWPRSKYLAAVTLLAVGIMGMETYQRLDMTAFENRAAVYLNSLAMVADKPWGQGIGGYWAAYPFYHDAVIETPEGVYAMQRRLKTAHNDFLTIAAETGLPGLLLIGWFLVRVLRSEGKRGAKWVLWTFLGLGLFNFPLFNPATAFLAAVTCGHLLNPGRDLRGQPLLRR